VGHPEGIARAFGGLWPLKGPCKALLRPLKGPSNPELNEDFLRLVQHGQDAAKTKSVLTKTSYE